MAQGTGLGIIDCDIHNVVPSIFALFPYLSEHWREYVNSTAFRGPADTSYPAGAPTSAAAGTAPEQGGPAGSDLDTLRAQVLDALGVEIGILNCSYPVESIHNPDSAIALTRAVNDWQIAEWLDREPRLRASIVVPTHYPPAAAEEIDRIGGHAGFVQVVIPARAEALYGNRRYHPIFEAAERNNLVVGVQFGGQPGNPPTGTGWPSYYIETLVNMSQVFQSQILSITSGGVFDQFPTLRMSLIEGGWTWLPSLLWRIDKDWKGLRREVPWNKYPPSEYVKRHIRLTTQPLDAPEDTRLLLQVVNQMPANDLLMFSTDYPHNLFMSVDEALPAGLPGPTKRKIVSETAREWYRL